MRAGKLTGLARFARPGFYRFARGALVRQTLQKFPRDFWWERNICFYFAKCNLTKTASSEVLILLICYLF
jgi:hypothetical protein